MLHDDHFAFVGRGFRRLPLQSVSEGTDVFGSLVLRFLGRGFRRLPLQSVSGGTDVFGSLVLRRPPPAVALGESPRVGPGRDARAGRIPEVRGAMAVERAVFSPPGTTRRVLRVARTSGRTLARPQTFRIKHEVKDKAGATCVPACRSTRSPKQVMVGARSARFNTWSTGANRPIGPL